MRPQALMKTPTTFFSSLLVLAVGWLVPSALAAQAEVAASKQELEDATVWLRTHHFSEEEFIRASKEPSTVILDASDDETYDELHIAGASPLSATSIEVLARLLPDNTRILIYQNNHFKARAKQRAAGAYVNELGVPFAGKWSGVNEQTCALLRHDGYRNVYELATYVEIDRGKLPLVTNIPPVHLDQPLVFSLRN